MKKSYFVFAACAALIAGPAAAVRQLTFVGQDLSTTMPTSFTFGGSTFSFVLSDPTSVTVQNSAGAAVEAFGGFFGIPLAPSASFTNRGDVQYGPTGTQYASFTSPTYDQDLNGSSFIGLRASSTAGNTFGFAYLDGSKLIGYGFDSAPGGTVMATTNFSGAVPEPATWAMMLCGFGLLGAAMRRRQQTVVTFA